MQDGRVLTGAWIETGCSPACMLYGARRVLTGAWIETPWRHSWMGIQPGRVLTGAWIETRWYNHELDRQLVASSRARGLKLVLPARPACATDVASSRARGLKLECCGQGKRRWWSRPHGRVD
ncbi:hypothetical protein [Xanthomonas oryzae pv. oryzae MAFF 311018]|nr:hypothetical protein [Xanthomonas oryzae pv. oryzae MAFF 311018]